MSHAWPVAGTYCRGSRQIGHSFFRASIDGDECCTPQVLQICRSDMTELLEGALRDDAVAGDCGEGSGRIWNVTSGSMMRGGIDALRI